MGSSASYSSFMDCRRARFTERTLSSFYSLSLPAFVSSFPECFSLPSADIEYYYNWSGSCFKMGMCISASTLKLMIHYGKMLT